MRWAQIGHRAFGREITYELSIRRVFRGARKSFWGPGGSAEVPGRFGGVAGRLQGVMGDSEGVREAPGGGLEKKNVIFFRREICQGSNEVLMFSV